MGRRLQYSVQNCNVVQLAHTFYILRFQIVSRERYCSLFGRLRTFIKVACITKNKRCRLS